MPYGPTARSTCHPTGCGSRTRCWPPWTPPPCAPDAARPADRCARGPTGRGTGTPGRSARGRPVGPSRRDDGRPAAAHPLVEPDGGGPLDDVGHHARAPRAAETAVRTSAVATPSPRRRPRGGAAPRTAATAPPVGRPPPRVVAGAGHDGVADRRAARLGDPRALHPVRRQPGRRVGRPGHRVAVGPVDVGQHPHAGGEVGGGPGSHGRRHAAPSAGGRARSCSAQQRGQSTSVGGEHPGRTPREQSCTAVYGHAS